MDDITRNALRKAQEQMEEANRQVDAEEFSVGKQQMYVAEFKIRDNFEDRIPRAIFVIKGAEESNKYAKTESWFQLLPDPDALSHLVRFMKKLGLEEKVDLLNIESQANKISNKVFIGDVVKSPGKKDPSKVYTNVWVRELVKQEDELPVSHQGEVPF